MCNAKLPQGCTFKGDCLPVEGRVCEGCPHMSRQTQIKEIVQQAILKVTGCKDLKSGELYLSRELTDAISSLIDKEVKEKVQQVRKDLIEECIKGLELHRRLFLEQTSPSIKALQQEYNIALDTCIAHLRAMAEEK